MGYAAALRQQLSELNRQYAKTHGLSHELSRGFAPAHLYLPTPSLHGNFHGASYREIVACAAWHGRFAKVHSHKRSLPACEHGWRELDSSNSSDALLMNVFCHPGTLRQRSVLHLLGIEEDTLPQFGFKARVPLKSGKFDRTEVDMLLGDLMVEAKLTEGDFQTKPRDLVERYQDLSKVFDKRSMPTAKTEKNGTEYLSYQLIRNVLAAYASGRRFCVILDQRRPDLVESWHSIQRAVKPAELRTRLQVLTWQELSEAAPDELREYLREKYGIDSSAHFSLAAART